jgi:hypothetical protein
MWECHHGASDSNGTPCLTDTCIENMMDTNTCDYKGPDWPCPKSRCDTWRVFPWEPALVQIIHNSTCPGGTVNWEIWHQFYEGCTSCVEQEPITKACQTNSCAHNPYPVKNRRGSRRECGKCPYLCR